MLFNKPIPQSQENEEVNERNETNSSSNVNLNAQFNKALIISSFSSGDLEFSPKIEDSLFHFLFF